MRRDRLRRAFRTRCQAGLWVGLSAGSLTSACGGSAGPEVPLPASPPAVAVTTSEYQFQYTGLIPAGRVVFQVRNEGSLWHELALLPLSDQLPPIDAQLRGSERQAIRPFAGAAPQPPGATGAFAVNLDPGRRYAFVCFVRDPDNATHAVKGMSLEFRTPPDGTPRP